MSILFNETSYENSIIELFKNMGYEYVYGPDIERDFRCPFYESELEIALSRINVNKPLNAIQGAINKLKNIENASLVQKILCLWIICRMGFLLITMMVMRKNQILFT